MYTHQHIWISKALYEVKELDMEGNLYMTF